MYTFEEIAFWEYLSLECTFSYEHTQQNREWQTFSSFNFYFSSKMIMNFKLECDRRVSKLIALILTESFSNYDDKYLLHTFVVDSFIDRYTYWDSLHCFICNKICFQGGHLKYISCMLLVCVRMNEKNSVDERRLGCTHKTVHNKSEIKTTICDVKYRGALEQCGRSNPVTSLIQLRCEYTLVNPWGNLVSQPSDFTGEKMSEFK